MTKKKLHPVNLSIDSNMDADDYGQRIVECINNCNISSSNILNFIKVDFGDNKIPNEHVSAYLKSISEMIKELNIENFLLVPIGDKLGIKDIQIDYLKIIETSELEN